jgi:hypothetical protein
MSYRMADGWVVPVSRPRWWWYRLRNLVGGGDRMAPLSTARRNRLPSSAFAYPRTRRYPIDTPARARNALARAAQPQTSGSYSTVARRVRARYGERVASVGRKRGTVTSPGYRRTTGTRRAPVAAAPRARGSRRR